MVLLTEVVELSEYGQCYGLGLRHLLQAHMRRSVVLSGGWRVTLERILVSSRCHMVSRFVLMAQYLP